MSKQFFYAHSRNCHGNKFSSNISYYTWHCWKWNYVQYVKIELCVSSIALISVSDTKIPCSNSPSIFKVPMFGQNMKVASTISSVNSPCKSTSLFSTSGSVSDKLRVQPQFLRHCFHQSFLCFVVLQLAERCLMKTVRPLKCQQKDVLPDHCLQAKLLSFLFH